MVLHKDGPAITIRNWLMDCINENKTPIPKEVIHAIDQVVSTSDCSSSIKQDVWLLSTIYGTKIPTAV